jgi:hypothetical protein
VVGSRSLPTSSRPCRGYKRQSNGPTSTFAKKLAIDFCKRIAEAESMRSVCANEKMPSVSTEKTANGANNVFNNFPAFELSQTSESLSLRQIKPTA